MKTLLEILGMFISKVIDSIQNNKVANIELTLKHITFIELSLHCIIREFQRISVAPDCEDIFSKYIKINQFVCTSACDKIAQLLKKQDVIDIEPSDELSTLTEQLREKLEDHLICLSNLYPNHYDSKMHVPTNLVQRLMQPITDDFNLLKLNFLNTETSHLLKLIGNEINLVTEGKAL